MQNQSPLNGTVKMMSSTIAFGVEITFDDVVKNLDCSKQQIARRFKLIVQQKQAQMRQEISDINTNNLQIMHSKSLYFQQVNKTNRDLKQQTLLKSSQIDKLNTILQQKTQNITALQNKLHNLQKSSKQFQQWSLNEHKRLQTVQTKYKQLLEQIQQEKHNKNELQRKVDYMKSQTTNWGDRIKYLLRNRELGLKNQYQQEIGKLKDILYYYQQNFKLMRQELYVEKQKFQEKKDSYQFTIKNMEIKYGLGSVPLLNHVNVQTQENTIKRIDVGVEIHVQCRQCQRINNVGRYMTRIHQTSQTDPDPRRFADGSSQTNFKFMQIQEQKNLIFKTRQTFKIKEKQIKHFQEKIQQLQKIMEIQPSKMEDLKKILLLENVISQKDQRNEMLKQQNLMLKSLNTILHQQIHSFKYKMTQITQFKIDSLQYQSKRNFQSTRMNSQTPSKDFFQIKKMQLQEYNNQKNIELNENRFSRTLNTNSRDQFSFTNTSNSGFEKQKTSPSREHKVKTAAQKSQKTMGTFFSQNQQTQRWNLIEKKIKNPELFSASPYINAVRRQKYKKYSSLKKKNAKQANVSFTVCF